MFEKNDLNNLKYFLLKTPLQGTESGVHAMLIAKIEMFLSKETTKQEPKEVEKSTETKEN